MKNNCLTTSPPSNDPIKLFREMFRVRRTQTRRGAKRKKVKINTKDDGESVFSWVDDGGTTQNALF